MRNRYADLVALGMAVVLVTAALLFAAAARGALGPESPRAGATGAPRAGVVGVPGGTLSVVPPSRSAVPTTRTPPRRSPGA